MYFKYKKVKKKKVELIIVAYEMHNYLSINGSKSFFIEFLSV